MKEILDFKNREEDIGVRQSACFIFKMIFQSFPKSIENRFFMYFK